jgi:hypothetical protein
VSIASGRRFLCDPDHHTAIDCLPSCRSAANPPKYHAHEDIGPKPTLDGDGVRP